MNEYILKTLSVELLEQYVVMLSYYVLYQFFLNTRLKHYMM